MGAAVALDERNQVTDARIFLGAVNSFPRACTKVQEALIGSPEYHELIQDMIDTLHEQGGIGLAAPQIGVLQRVMHQPLFLDACLLDRYRHFRCGVATRAREPCGDMQLFGQLSVVAPRNNDRQPFQ